MRVCVPRDICRQQVLCLKDVSQSAIAAIKARAGEIAAVLVNPLQCFHPNAAPPSDLVLASNFRSVCKEVDYYKPWLHQLRKVCDECDITLIFDEVYTGFRLAKGGAQEVFDVRADLITYGKTVAGGARQTRIFPTAELHTAARIRVDPCAVSLIVPLCACGGVRVQEMQSVYAVGRND
jgi:glutamate-1-semialdehyde aminotransferase